MSQLLREPGTNEPIRDLGHFDRVVEAMVPAIPQDQSPEAVAERAELTRRSNETAPEKVGRLATEAGADISTALAAKVPTEALATTRGYRGSEVQEDIGYKKFDPESAIKIIKQRADLPRQEPKATEADPVTGDGNRPTVGYYLRHKAEK